MRLAIIFNTGSGAHQYSPEDLRRLIAQSAADVQVMIPDEKTDLQSLAHSASQSQFDVVIAAGGDGTVNTVASALLRCNGSPQHTPKVMGVLPLGTLNHLAKDLALPLDVPAAVEVMLKGKLMEVDAGEVNGHAFLNMSSVGLYPRIIDLRERRRRAGWPKWIAHAISTIAALTEFVIYPVKLEINGRTLRRWSPTITVTNNEYKMEGQNLGARQSLCGGKLNILIARTYRRSSLLKVAILALLGRLKRAPEVEIISCTEVILHMHARNVRVAVDGEVKAMSSPLQYRIRPASLKIIVPPNAEQAMRSR